jgi:hypothetical protein
MAIELREYRTDRPTMAPEDRDPEPVTVTAAAASRMEAPVRPADETDGTPAAAAWCCGIECC